jgi:prepilin-type N-terminal cleavage/methylation domain-containing protein
MEGKRVNEQGFTLVELAIVMIIIGLLIAGILKGQQMIENARITSTVSQIKAIDAAASTFSDMYSALPGDIQNPGGRLPSCTGRCDLGATGGGTRGDGRVGAGSATAVGAAITMNSENRAFFTHLAAADLITGVSTNPATLGLNDALPSTEVGSSGFGVGFTTTGGATSLIGTGMRSGHYLSIRPSSAALTMTSGAGALTQSQAARIDRKLDDGVATTGSVRAGGATTCVNRTAYREADEVNDCNLFIRIQG